MCGSVAAYVSDTTAITNLAAIGQLALMRAVFRQIVIPQEVFDELTRHGDHIPGAREVKSSDWITIRPVSNRVLVDALSPILDQGEAEAIALAQELGARLLIIDEYAGRQAAAALNIRVIGLVGILIEAKHRGLIDSVKPLIDRLRREAGFRLGSAFVARVLKEVGED